MSKPTVAAAIAAARKDVTELRSNGYENGYREWHFLHYDYGYEAWVESAHTWRASAAQSRRLALVRAALDWACRKFNMAISYDSHGAIEQGVWANHSVRDVLKAELPRLEPTSPPA